MAGHESMMYAEHSTVHGWDHIMGEAWEAFCVARTANAISACLRPQRRRYAKCEKQWYLVTTLSASPDGPARVLYSPCSGSSNSSSGISLGSWAS